MFDLVYNYLAHHYYPEPSEAAASVLQRLRQGGIYCIKDAGDPS